MTKKWNIFLILEINRLEKPEFVGLKTEYGTAIPNAPSYRIKSISKDGTLTAELDIPRFRDYIEDKEYKK